MTIDWTELFDQAPCGYVVLDGDGLIIANNEAFLRLVGRSRADVGPSCSFASLITAGGRIYYETHLLPMLSMQRTFHEVALELLRPDGDRVPVLVSARRRTAGPGAATQVLLVVFEARDRRRYETDLLAATQSAERARAESAALVQTLQKTLIPPVPPTVAGLDIAASYRPAGDGTEVGGDFYDVFQVAEKEWVLALGDVSGKGITAATLTTFVRHTVRALAMQVEDPATLLCRLNEALNAHPTDRFATMVLIRVRDVDGSWRLTSSAGGHPLPLIRHADGSVSELGTPGSPLGLINEGTFHNAHHELHGETVTLYTDGVTEARRGSEQYGDDRLVDLLAQLGPDPRSLTDGVVAAALAFQDDDPRDDIAVLTFRDASDPLRL